MRLVNLTHALVVERRAIPIFDDAVVDAGAEGRPDLSAVDTTDPDYLQEAVVPMGDETHGGDDVGIWARGPGAAAVRGSVEQNAIFHFLLQASPRLRASLCGRGYCDGNGIPVELPDPAAFRTASPAPATPPAPAAAPAPR